MLTMTDAAGALLTDLLRDANAPDEAAIRLFVEEKGLSMKLDNEKPGDDSFAHDGRTVLLLDEQLSTMLSERTLDTEEAAEGLKLTLK